MGEIVLPFPPATLSGHNTGHWRGKAGIVKAHRQDAAKKVSEANITAPEHGDLLLTVTFIAPDRRGDRVNYPNRMKPYFDGIADQLGVNDSRFLPRFLYAPVQSPGQVHVAIRPVSEVHEGGLPTSTREIVL